MHIFQSGNAYPVITRFFGIFYIDTFCRSAVNADIINRRTSVYFMLQKFIIFFRQCFITSLCNSPGSTLIPVHRCTAHIIAHARVIIGRKNIFFRIRACTLCINRAKGNSFVSIGIHDFIERFPFQKRITCIHPFFIGRWCKFVKLYLRKFGFFI